MKKAVIDVGSNSVRLLLDGRKTTINTQLAEKAGVGGKLLPEAMSRTAEAIRFLKEQAENAGAKTFVFATEAVRSASNKEEFLSQVRVFGAEIDVLPPEKEAEIGFFGAYDGVGTKAVLDVGGASSELAVGNEKGLLYAHSLPIGSVRIKDYSQDFSTQSVYIKERVKEYGSVPPFDELVSIGGTSSSLIAIRDEVEPYDPSKIHLQKITKEEIKEVVDRINATPVEERKHIKGLHPKMILVIPAGGAVILGIMEYLGLNEITVSETDNLEGYLSRIL